MTIITAIINDHTRLGGPMGSEYVTEIAHRIFADDDKLSGRDKAMAWVCKWISTNRSAFEFPPNWKKMNIFAKLKLLTDAGSFGVKFEKEQVY